MQLFLSNMKFSIRLIATVNGRRLQVKHEPLWADQIAELECRFLEMRGKRSFQTTDLNTSICVYGMKVSRLLTKEELNDLSFCGTPDRTPFDWDDSPQDVL